MRYNAHYDRYVSIHAHLRKIEIQDKQSVRHDIDGKGWMSKGRTVPSAFGFGAAGFGGVYGSPAEQQT